MIPVELATMPLMVAQLELVALAVLNVYCDLQPYWLLALIQLPDVPAVELALPLLVEDQ